MRSQSRCRRRALALLALPCLVQAAFPQAPYGLDTRDAIGPYLNNIMPPTSDAFPFPLLLSATGAFTDLANPAPVAGLIPFTVNSPLWSDGAIKMRWMAVPNDGAPYGPNEQVRFAPTGEWSFPNGTVFVKEFDLVVNENTGERKRLETRLLVRDATGGVYGVTYKWRSDNSDADLLTENGLDENIPVVTTAGTVRIQKWSYPSRSQCLFCHNAPANYVLGVKTHQLNGDFVYPATGRTDNQIRTLAHLSLLNPTPSETEIPLFLKSVAITTPNAPVEYRMRSWIDSNCSQCHRPGGFCPSYDARFYTPLKDQNLIDTFVRFRDLAGSELYQRDNSLGDNKMPPLAKNVIHEAAMANLRQWIASPLEVLSVNLYQDPGHLVVRFNSHLDPASVSTNANYSLDQGITISEATPGPDPDTILLTVSPLSQNQVYILTISDVRDTAPSANTIWPGSRISFAARFAQEPATSRLANVSTRLRAGAGDEVLIVGFIVRGPPAKRIMVRAIGPSLSSNGISNVLADPFLELRDSSGVVVASNDNWSENYNRQEIIDTGLAPAAGSEAVILSKLPSNAEGVAYTAILRGVNGGTGMGVIEVYDLDRTGETELANVSTRGLVQTGDNVLIAGMIVQGPTSQKIIVRAIGPSLSIPGKLANPILELHDFNGALLETNDDWTLSADKQAIIDSGLAPTNDSESAILRTMPPGAYTTIVRGVGDTIGIAVVEAYALD